ncbi:extended synaptotagmin-1-like isoform X21 [Oncorhynchus keta]|uniref:extended synaptotagmin-1-like isoform X20 n=1 Tax=Oncorhynchus keta TaxID=8018 RepID=UPI00227A6746|nr:extended synaptotagmin-1-like isoform X20 [Oncorhynchus keta]XP_052329583.1 extended synaptotagmin-1-like isoform X21 [Oncorhynchus keta]
MQNPDSGHGESTKNASGSVHSDNKAPNSGEIKPPGFDAVSVLWTFGKCLGALLPVYLAGYYRVSASFLVFGFMVYTGWRHSREAKEARLRSAIHHYDNEKQYTSMNIFRSKKDLPAWVNFPDVEKVEWLNKILQQVWPFVGQYLEKLLVETIAPSIRSSSTHLQTLTFTKVDFGDKAMKVVGVKAHTENERGQVLLDVYISYVGNVEINVEVKRYFCKAGVKGIQLHGMMRVILEPLIGDVPIVGAVTMFFIRRPKLDINWTGLTNLLDIPGLNIMSDTMIMDAIASFLVLPNRLTVPLVADLHVAQLRSPLPRGVVRIHLLEADDLPAKDNYMKGVIAGLSDPYALCRVGPQTFTSHVVDNTVCPKWGEMYEVIVHEVPGQELEVEVYDKDPDNDDFLGRTKIDLGIVKKSKVVDEWFTLKETKSGRVHFRLEWLVLLPNTERLEQVLQRNESMTVSSKTSDPPSAAILAVYLDKAEALPMKKGNKEPSPMVQLSVQDITRESRTCWTTINPKWEDAFTFFIPDPHKQSIDIQVKDNDRIQTLGSLSIPLSRLLSGPNLSLDQWFQLDKSGPASRIYINTVLRVLWLDEENIPTCSTEAAKLAAGLSKIRPQQTSPDPSFATEGVLRIHLLEGQNLVPKDNMMGGMVKGKSDPYVKINIGGETFESRVINRNLNPTWNEMYEVVLTTLPGQELHVELFDKDMDMKDDFMGRLKISLKDIITSQYTDQWYTLNDVKSGRLHLVLEWVPSVSQPDRLDQVFQFQSRQSYHNKAFPSMALLFVFVERADGLPLKKSGKEPKVGAELVVGGTSHKTTVCDRTISPQWDEAFYFLVHDPREEILIVKLSHSWTLPIGSLVVPVRELLSEPDLVLDQWLNLDGASPDSQILLRAELKVLCPKKCEIDVERADQPRARAASTVEQILERDTVQQRCISVDTPSAPSPSPSSIPAPVPEPEEAKRVTVTEMVPEEVTEEPCLPGTLPTHTNPEPSFGSEGVLRIHLLEAQNLIAKDNLMGGLKKGKSDPYVKINIGGVKFKSHLIKENLNPTWNEMYETVMTPQSDQEVQVELYDKDMDKDDFLGRCNISMRDIIHSQYTDQWYTLNDVKSGRVHLVLEWVPTVSQPDRLDQVLQLQSLQSYQNKAVPSAALLFVYMDRAHSLPLKKSGKEPNAGAELVLGETTYRTKVCDRTNSPQWEEAFYFLVRDPREEILIVKLSSAWDQAMGSLVVPVRELLSEPDLVLDQWLSLDGASPDSQILLRAELKVLCPKKCEIDVERADQPRARAASTAEQILERDTVQQRCISVDTPSAPSPSPSSIPAPVPEPEEAKRVTVTEMVPEEVTEEPCLPGTLPTHTNPEPSFGSEGVLRIHLLEAQNLIAKDNVMGGLKKGKSDPYVKINIGGVKFKSHVIKENLNPTWNEMYETVMTPQSDQEVQVELYDKDMDKDDFLGRCNISMRDIIHSQYTDQWYTLNDVKSGRVHLVLEWVPTVSQPDRLDQVLQLQSLQSYQNKAVPSAALLFVYMDRAHSLPLKKSGKEPKAGAELVLGETTYRTKVCDRTNSPQWEEAFYFLVRDPREEILIVKLSSAWDQAMGSLVVPVRELLSEPDLVLDQWLSLDGASPDSQILLRAELKILNSKMTEGVGVSQGSVSGPEIIMSGSYSEEKEQITIEQPVTATIGVKQHSEVPSEESVAVSSQPSISEPEEAEVVFEVPKEDSSPPETLPPHTTPDPSFDTEIEEPEETEEPITQLSVTADTEELQPWQGPTAGSVTEDIARATVSSLPSVSVPEEAEVMPDVIPETRPPHTTPHPCFGTEGVLRIHVLEAQDLVAMDKLMGGLKKGKSDPYVKINIGVVKFKSHVIKENLNPTWNEMFETVLNPQAGQEVQVELYDKDMDADDFLGRFMMRLSDVISSQYTDQWYTLNDVKSGRLHLVLEWVPTVSQPDRLDQVLQLQSLQSYQNKAVPSAALLFVYMVRAHSLPMKKSGKEPKAGAELVLGETTYRTKVCDRTNSPSGRRLSTFWFVIPKKRCS